MAGYLEAYAAVEEGKAKTRQRLKIGSIVTVSALIVGLLLYGGFRNFHQERVVKTFLRDLQDHQEQQAYRMWGCTDQTPCRDYAFSKFMEDWGPASAHAQAGAKIALSQSCGNGTFVRLDYPKAEAVGLMVDKTTDVISFAPSTWVECPGKHWHFWDFIQRLFRG